MTMVITKTKTPANTPELRNRFYTLIDNLFGPDTQKFFINAYKDEGMDRIIRDCTSWLTDMLGPKKAEIEIQKILSGGDKS